jgi:hypothetical protein
MKSLIDTDIKNNISHIRPYLGILLIGSIALGFTLLVHRATTQLTQTIHTTTPEGVSGKLSLQKRGTIVYGDTIDYKSSVIGGYSHPVNTYVTTVCFQGDEMVFQRSAQQGVPIHLYDQIGGGLEWDGGTASCSATLMYREVNSDTVDVYVVDGVSFDVEARGY